MDVIVRVGHGRCAWYSETVGVGGISVRVKVIVSVPVTVSLVGVNILDPVGDLDTPDTDLLVDDDMFIEREADADCREAV